ncbi:MAG: shikimate dehydrogenase [Clostridia bacterium]|nr:shikimate dehydrogenase [Clostridia bacterium]
MNGKKLRLALIGKDVSASDSPKIHEFILRQWGVALEYESLSLAAEELDGAARRLLGDFDGFNVTIPYKRDIMEYLEYFSSEALAFGAVNTVKSANRGGYNTDGIGFLMLLESEGVAVAGKRALVLGAGGAGRSSAVALKNAGACVYLYQRRTKELLETCEELGVSPCSDPEAGGFDLLVNATGVGMHATVGVSPVSERAFRGVGAAIDLIYRPKQTEFLRLAALSGVKAIAGGAMLFYQAYYSDCIYLSKQPSQVEAKAFYAQYLCETKGER